CSEAWPRAHNLPCEIGERGFPSALIARPSRVRMFMPHPAGHSRHVVRYQVERPGTISSCGVTYGSSRSAPWVLHPKRLAPAPAAPSTFRKSRLSIPFAIVLLLTRPHRPAARPRSPRHRHRSSASVVVNEAVDARLPLLVAVDAPPHPQRLRKLDLRHLLDGAVTVLTRDPGVHVHHVREPNVLRKIVDPDPGDRDLRLRILHQLLQLRAV